MRTCDGCRFCCWSFNAHDVPDPVQGFIMKPARAHCAFECSAGCELHDTPMLPQMCDQFKCSYLEGADIHRPDSFQFLEELECGIGNFIPAIPSSIPVRLAKSLILEHRTLPAFVILGEEWARVILPLDRNKDRTWTVKDSDIELWKKVFDIYDEKIDLLPAGMAGP